MFGKSLLDDINQIANAVRVCTLSKGKETAEEAFLEKMFLAFPKETQMEVLIHSSQSKKILYEKCQCMLVLVKLHPEVIREENGVSFFIICILNTSEAIC